MPKTGTLLRRSNTGYADIHHSCTVRFLDEAEQLTVTFQKSSRGQEIIDFVCSNLNLVERDYFGLRYVDSDKQRHWLDGARSACLQLKGSSMFLTLSILESRIGRKTITTFNVNPLILCFRVKFYPSDPSKLKEEITRYYLYLQLVRDLHHGRLICSQTEANQLAAYIVQDELGDYDEQLMTKDYISQIKMLPKQCLNHETSVENLHKELVYGFDSFNPNYALEHRTHSVCVLFISFKGKVPADVEKEFLDVVCKLETYGVDPHSVKDAAGLQKYLGMTHHGIVTFQGNKRTHLFAWPTITKLDFDGKYFIVQVNESEVNSSPSGTLPKQKKRALQFKCVSAKASKHLWKCAVEQQYFFTLSNSASAPKVSAGRGFLRRGSSFRFSGHCEKEAFAESAGVKRDEPQFTRSASNPSLMFSGNRSFGSNTLPAGFKPSMMLDSSLESEDSRLISVSLNEGRGEEGPSLVITDLSTEFIEEEQEGVEPPAEGLQGVKADQPLEALPVMDGGGDRVHGGQEQDEVFSSDIESAQHVPQVKRENGLEAVSKPNEYPVTQQINPVGNGGKALSAPPPKPKSNALRNTITFLIIATMFVLLFLYLVYETNADIPIISSVREFPEVQHFRKNYYHPARSAILG